MVKLQVSLSTIMTLLWFLAAPWAAAAQADIEGKIVLANLDRYEVVIRIGEHRRTIQPRKASVLTPRSYPATIEYWSGNKRDAWQRQTFEKAGVYGCNFKRGKWIIAEVRRGTTAARPQPSRQVLRQRVIQRPTRRPMINADRARWSPLARVAWAAASLYQFVRDEQDRDLLRDVIVRGRLEDLEDLMQWVDAADTVALPHKEGLKDALRELHELSEEDWKTIESADEAEWDLAKEDLGDLVTQDQWDKFNDDFADINTTEFWEEDANEVDLHAIEFADNLDVDGDGDLDFGEEFDLSEGVDLVELGIGSDTYDLAEFDDFDGFDGAIDVDADDFGGGFFGDDDFGDFGGGDDFDFDF